MTVTRELISAWRFMAATGVSPDVLSDEILKAATACEALLAERDKLAEQLKLADAWLETNDRITDWVGVRQEVEAREAYRKARGK